MVKHLFHSLLFFLVFTLGSNDILGQVSGSVMNADGTSLPYVNIFKEGTTSGTATNEEGQFSIEAMEGDILIFRYIGFTDYKHTVASSNEEVAVTMSESAVSIEEVVISADAEDPAYPIIRKAIAKRDYYKNQVDKYTVNTYAKGLVKMLEAPEKIFGQKVGDMGGMIDTTGQGIVYLSESQSKVYAMAPDKLKEVMHSSIVSGSDGSFNINRLTNVQYDIYEEYFKFTRTVINPLADNALAYHKYKLEGVIYEDGREINKIKVIPKSANRPVASGYIYIAEDSWNVVQLDLKLSGKSLKEPIFDTIRMRQQFLPVGDDGVWRLFSQEMGFTAGGFGFKVGGTFSYIFSDYDVNPDLEASFFNKEEFRMEETATVTDSAFWQSVRPVPLTYEEKNDYIKKDSLRRLWESKPYMDSLDRENNKFTVGSLLFGHTIDNSYKRRSISFDSPLTTYLFNVVEGSSIGTGIGYQTSDSSGVHSLSVKSNLRYGFTDKRVKADVSIQYRTNRVFQEYIGLSGGDSYKQYFNENPVMPLLNTFDGLLYKVNNIRLYNSQYIDANYQREIANGLFLFANIGFERRNELSRFSDFSIFNKDKVYAENIPPAFIGDETTDPDFIRSTHQYLKVRLKWRPGQTYASYPTFRIREISKWPTFNLYYTKGINMGGLSDTNFDKLRLLIIDQRMSMREFGHGMFKMEAGTFLNKKKLSYVDNHHFYTNTNTVTNLDNYLSLYKLMDHYIYSSSNDYLSFHYEHHFDGYIMDKIPLLKDMGAKFVLGANTLQMVDAPAYYEGSIGIDQLKIGLFSVFRFDYAWSFNNDGLLDHGFFLGVGTNIGG